MASDISRHFKALRVQTARRRRDPFEDDSDDEVDRRRTSSTAARQPAAPVKTPTSATTAQPAPAPTKSSALSATDILVDSDDDWLVPAKRSDRRPSPAPTSLSAAARAGRRGSLDAGLALRQRLPAHRDSRSARVQAAGPLAYLDDSDGDEKHPLTTVRTASPAPPSRQSDSVDGQQRRSSTPRGTRDPPSEVQPVQPSRHTVASPFAGTKYLEDSDSDEEAVTSRSNSTDDTAATSVAAESEKKETLEVQRVDKPKVQNGGGVSWRAFSASRAEQRNTEIETLQASLRSRGKSISFGSHALTDDGQRVPIARQQFLASGRGGKRGRAQNRGKSPPRRDEDTRGIEEEAAEGGPVGIYDPREYKTNPFTGA